MKTEIKKFSMTAIVAVLSSVFTVLAVNQFSGRNSSSFQQQQADHMAKFAKYAATGNYSSLPDFTYPAALTTPGVVHIKTEFNQVQQSRGFSNDPFRDFFGGQDFGFHGFPYQQGPSEASGSGVIISDDGYIVTNNHVVENGDEVKVILYDKREFKAEVIGTDPSTDLALLKIDEKNLPFIQLGNSDSVQVGSWVLAVGNPFNLESTVTAGIVSAKGRNINILKDSTAIESFIQTDAAVNPGNSGGALVNTRGELIGINSAIATPTGSFAGYSFAIPVNIVVKVMDDLKKYGVVQRGYLGVSIANVTDDLAKEKSLKDLKGVYVNGVVAGGAGEAAGIKAGDVITQVNGMDVNSSPELLEQISKFHPGDKVVITLHRSGIEKMVTATLKNKAGDTGLVKKDDPGATIDALGADFANLSAKDAKTLGITGGVKVTKLRSGKLSQYTDIREGFIITKLDNKPVNSVDDLKTILAGKTNGGVMVEGVYADAPGKYFYAFGLN